MFVLLMNRPSGRDTGCKSVKSVGKVKKAVKSPPSGKSTPNANVRDHKVDNGNSDKKEVQDNSESCIEYDAKEGMDAQIHPIARLCKEDPTPVHGRIDLLSHVPLLRLVIPNIENIFNTNEHRRLKMTHLDKKYSIDEFFATLDLDSQTRGEIT